jgi:DhnA family fructose-bisphosphate aldolase class Ia
MIPIIGKPITRIPQMDNIIAAVGEADKKVQSTCGMASQSKAGVTATIPVAAMSNEKQTISRINKTGDKQMATIMNRHLIRKPATLTIPSPIICKVLLDCSLCT